MKSFLLVLSVVCACMAQFNYSGWKDTAAVNGWRGTASGTTRAFELSQYENIRFYACAVDTHIVGYGSDSIHFQWGIEIGDVIQNRSGFRDTSWQERIIIDTFNIRTSANLVKQYKVIDSSGTVYNLNSFIDTIGVAGWAVQDRNPFNGMPWAPIFRYWYIGMAGNRTADGYIPLMFGQSRRVYLNVHNQ